MLAGGSGTRLSCLTSGADGEAVPKQFCSLDGGLTLIEQTLARAAKVADRDCVTAIVASAHRRYWSAALKSLLPENLVVQPRNRGTAIGILLPALRIAARDPQARIVILPSDHHVADESALEHALRCALEDVRCHPGGVALLGIEADEPDPELGYIVCDPASHRRLRQVHRFIEKPRIDEALRLVRQGALWNSFILVCRARSLIDLISRRYLDIVQMFEAVGIDDEASLRELYRELPEIDFSRDVAAGQEGALAVMAVPRCGWSDLGTPHRLAQTLARWPTQCWRNATTRSSRADGWINLAERLAQVHPTCCTRRESSPRQAQSSDEVRHEASVVRNVGRARARSSRGALVLARNPDLGPHRRATPARLPRTGRGHCHA
ncbi:MAG TPA: sugar phosphate nucleotidyltransferase [Steroidobacteraceae bacterium]|nr:sugar phosphate nucleotidyltransferase [Steroidobacteraceae bacterium]